MQVTVISTYSDKQQTSKKETHIKKCLEQVCFDAV